LIFSYKFLHFILIKICHLLCGHENIFYIYYSILLIYISSYRSIVMRLLMKQILYICNALSIVAFAYTYLLFILIRIGFLYSI
jgi:hypothetical protein